MGSFLGCKVLGVNTQTQHPVEAMELAEYLTNEKSQARRFEVLGYVYPFTNSVCSLLPSPDCVLVPFITLSYSCAYMFG